MPDRPSRARVLAAFAAIYIIWGSTYLAIRYAIGSIPPFLMAGARFTIAGSILFVWARSRGAPAPERRHWVGAGVVGVLLLVGGNGGVVWAEQRVPSGLTALLVAVVPVWTVLVEWVSAGGQRPRFRVVLGLVAGFAGVALLVAPGRGGGGVQVDPVAALVLLVASASWSIGSVYSRRAALPASPRMATAMEMLVGGGCLLLAGVVSGEVGRLAPAAVTRESLLGLLYLIIFGSLIAFSAFVWLLRVSTPSRVSTYAYVNPVVAVLLGWAVAGEALTPRVVLAAAVIVGAVVLITSRGARPGESPPSLAPGRSPSR